MLIGWPQTVDPNVRRVILATLLGTFTYDQKLLMNEGLLVSDVPAGPGS